jgi:ubiquinone/menaquinone biosynthesis C-methylase UbiE
VIAMTEWNAPEYARISALQAAMAAEAVSLLDLNGAECVLDVGCGNGRTTAEIAARLPRGSVLGVDASTHMVGFATEHVDAAEHRNLRFLVADARDLAFDAEFDLIVSFNALHWIPEQERALRSIRRAIKPDGRAQLRLVPKAERKSLEDVIAETCSTARWNAYFPSFRDPYLHLTAEQYARLCEQEGFRVLHVRTHDKAWDFQSRAGFNAFGSVTFVEWTQHLPEPELPAFISDVLDRYSKIASQAPGQENYFRFYQMDIMLAPIECEVG